MTESVTGAGGAPRSAADAGARAGGAGGADAVPMRGRALLLAICCSSMFMVGLDITIVNVGLPAIARSLHTQVAGLQWTVDGYTIVLASLLMSSGAIADRIGRRTMFQVGLSVFTLGSWLCSVAPSLGWLLVFRLVQGAGGSMLNPSALGIITNVFTRPAERARALGLWDATTGLSMALGPVIGGVLVGVAGWRGIFWVNIPVGLAAMALTALFVPDTRAGRVRRPDPVGQVLVIVMLASLCYAIITGPGDGWLSPRISGFFALAAVALTVLLVYERRHAEPLLDLRLFRSVPFAGSALAAICAIGAQSGFLFLAALYLQDVRGLSALSAGMAITPMPIAMALCSALAGRVVARSGARVPLVSGGGALALSSAALSLLDTHSATPFLAVTYGLFGAGIGLFNPGITYGVMSGVPRAQASVASGMLSSCRQLGIALGTAVIGSLLAASLRGGMRTGFLSAAYASWWVLAGCGCTVLLLGLVITSGWAKVTAARAGAADETR